MHRELTLGEPARRSAFGSDATVEFDTYIPRLRGDWKRSVQYISKKLEVTCGLVRVLETRIARNRKKPMPAKDRDLADELQAMLLIMEQSLISMTRFLRIVERELEDKLDAEGRQAPKRGTKARRKEARPKTVHQGANRFPPEGNASVRDEDNAGQPAV